MIQLVVVGTRLLTRFTVLRFQVTGPCSCAQKATHIHSLEQESASLRWPFVMGRGGGWWWLGKHRCSVLCTRGFAQTEGENVSCVGISPLVFGDNQHVLGCDSGSL